MTYEVIFARFRARRGSYRILYDIDGEKMRVQILWVAHRADVYRSR